MTNSFLQKFRNAMLYCLASTPKFSISGSLCLKIIQRLQNNLDEFNSDQNVITRQKTHYYSSDKKITHDFLYGVMLTQIESQPDLSPGISNRNPISLRHVVFLTQYVKGRGFPKPSSRRRKFAIQIFLTKSSILTNRKSLIFFRRQTFLPGSDNELDGLPFDGNCEN